MDVNVVTSRIAIRVLNIQENITPSSKSWNVRRSGVIKMRYITTQMEFEDIEMFVTSIQFDQVLRRAKNPMNLKLNQQCISIEFCVVNILKMPIRRRFVRNVGNLAVIVLIVIVVNVDLLIYIRYLTINIL